MIDVPMVFIPQSALRISSRRNCFSSWLNPAILSQQIAAMPSRPFTATRSSLQGYKVPEWFADAKFGIWAHWGPQSAVGYGDW